ncbi:MAG: hypothetical protein HOL08_01880 [Opitutae bacterium]|nr:hypothetical protein [Opitutae bacterium]
MIKRLLFICLALGAAQHLGDHCQRVSRDRSELASKLTELAIALQP